MENTLLLSLRECHALEWYSFPADHRCPHDAWVQSISVYEPYSGSRSEFREIEIQIRLLAAYHDGIIEFTYRQVLNYSLKASDPSGHGDWLKDEVEDRGESIVHTVFLTKGRFQIEAKEVEYKWDTLAVSPTR